MRNPKRTLNLADVSHLVRFLAGVLEALDLAERALDQAVAISYDLEPLEREAARKRQGYEAFSSGNFPELNRGVALDHVARAVGMSRPTLEKARAFTPRGPGRHLQETWQKRGGQPTFPAKRKSFPFGRRAVLSTTLPPPWA